MKKQINQTIAFRNIVRLANRFFPVQLAKLRFRKYFGRKMNLKSPQDINEKISWLALFSDTSEWTRLADKYAVREYVKECGLENNLVKLYGKWDSAKEIDWDGLPNSFVLKTNNGSGTVLVVSDKSRFEKNHVIDIMDKWLHKKIAAETTEFHYKDIAPCVIAEEYLEPSEAEKTYSSSIVDYKVWCFNGIVDSIWTCSNRDSNGCEVALFDKDWNYHPEASVFNEHYREQKHLTPKPSCLMELIEVAEKLSMPFPVVRVDLYVIKDHVYFGEMTFTSLGGTMNFYTQEKLLEMGEKIDLSGVKLKRNKFN